MSVRILTGDCRDVLRFLPDESVHCVVTSPPYFGLRDYGVSGQIGLQATPDAFVYEMVAVFREVRRVLRADGTCWQNLGDSYAANRPYQVPQTKHGSHDFGQSNASRVPDGLKPKDLIGIPWRVAFALQADGWWLRQDIIWHRPNPMQESIRDRWTKAHEYLFLLTKSERYVFDAGAIAEASAFPKGPGNIRPADGLPGERENANIRGGLHQVGPREFRNKRSVWTVATQPFAQAHFATFPPDLIEPCILAGGPTGGTVLDPFGGAGTTGLVADRLDRDAILIELNPAYAEMARNRLSRDAGMFATVAAE